MAESKERGDRKLDLNEVTMQELLRVEGIDEQLASRILAYREEHAGFRSVAELQNLGFGDANDPLRRVFTVRGSHHGGPEGR